MLVSEATERVRAVLALSSTSLAARQCPYGPDLTGCCGNGTKGGPSGVRFLLRYPSTVNICQEFGFPQRALFGKTREKLLGGAEMGSKRMGNKSKCHHATFSLSSLQAIPYLRAKNDLKIENFLPTQFFPIIASRAPGTSFVTLCVSRLSLGTSTEAVPVSRSS